MDLAAFRILLTITPARWMALAQAYPNELLDRQPAPGEWSACECLQHIVQTEMVYQERLKHFLEGHDFPAFNPNGHGDKPQPVPTTLDLTQQFARLRQASLTSLAAVTPNDLGRTVRHAELGPVTLSQMVNTWVAHDLNHTVQAERALMQPFIAACGPWKVYYKDHFIEQA